MGPPTAEEYTWFYSMKNNKNDEGFYYFAKRPTKGLQAVMRIRDNLGSWKESYFFHSRGPSLRHLRQSA